MPRNALYYLPRDNSLCQHIALYRIGILPLLEKHFGGHGNIGNAVRRLSESNSAKPKEPPLLQRFSKALPKGRSYSQLTNAGCRRFGVSSALAAPLGKAALDQATAVAFACAFQEPECHRVTRNELLPLLGSDTPSENVVHLLSASSEADEAPRILRVYHATSDIQTATTHITRLVEMGLSRKTLAEWISHRRYGFAILCPTQQAVSAMATLLDSSGLRDAVAISVMLGPTSDTLDEALRAQR